MCDENTVAENEALLDKKFSKKFTGVSRRQFTAWVSASTLATLLPNTANAMHTQGDDVSVPMSDGTADCYFVHPAEGQHPGVIIWPDVLGLRPAFRAMATRLAESGYAVLVVNPYYRMAKSPVVAPGASFQDAETRETVLPLARALTADTNVSDAKAFVAFLDKNSAVDVSRKIGTTGYCMGGPMTMRTAAAIPSRIGAGASFHGGRLVTDGEDSPHLLIPTMKSEFLFAIASNDDERDPEAKNVLRKSYDAAGLNAEIEVYAGAMHGWCPPDSRVYNEVQAERAWSRLLVLFERALKVVA